MATDTQLQQDVMAQLGWEPSVNAAQRVAGVKGRLGRLAVRQPRLNIPMDADIAHAAENALRWWTYLPINAVKVEVDNGWITLSGEVERDDQRQAAVDAVRHLRCVTGIREKININPGAFSEI